MSASTASLEPLEDLSIAVSLSAAAQTSIQHADTKAATLLTGLVGLAALVSSESGVAAAAMRVGLVATGCMAGLWAAFVIGGLVAVWHLGRCLTPRLTGPVSPTGNRFALPDLGTHGRPCGLPTVGEQRDDAWSVAEVLAGIAMQKFRAVRASLPWIATAAVGSVGWVCLALAIGAR
jgi:hypothetical protein